MKVAILITFVSFCLISCGLQIPRLMPDVLKAGPEVRINPVGTIIVTEDKYIVSSGIDDGEYFIINQEFLSWVLELKAEIKRLRN